MYVYDWCSADFLKKQRGQWVKDVATVWTRKHSMTLMRSATLLAMWTLNILITTMFKFKFKIKKEDRQAIIRP